MTPEEKARIKIDRWFAEAGWQVVNRDEFEPTMSAVAVREGFSRPTILCLSTARFVVCWKPSVRMSMSLRI